MSNFKVIINSRKVLRKPDDLPPDTGCWKNCTCFTSAEGLKKLTMSCNIVGRDRYDDFRDYLSDGEGKFFRGIHCRFPAKGGQWQCDQIY